MTPDEGIPGPHVAPEPVGLYQPFVRCGRLLSVSAISSGRNGVLVTGKVGRDLDLASGQVAARNAAENLLAVMLEAVGRDPSGIEQILFVRGYVNAADDFPAVHKVIDAASQLLVERLGEKGRHARTALGCATLPNNNAVTLEAIVVLADGRFLRGCSHASCLVWRRSIRPRFRAAAHYEGTLSVMFASGRMPRSSAISEAA